MGAATSEEIERLKAKHAQEMKDLGRQHDEHVAQLNANFDSQIALKERDHADTVE